jgi:CO dehydrogenase maturation factor
MIIGFLGKGGSGKTTLATLFTKYLIDKGNKVLAIDADHNMDFSFNLGAGNSFPYFGQSMSEIKSFTCDSSDIKKTAREILVAGPKNTFSFSPKDEYTKNYSVDKSEKLTLMVAGPHTEEIMEGDKCSHTLFTSLKIYLPFLKLNQNEFAVVDEKAGMDPVGTIVPIGFDVAIISVEPTVHSTKAANQISAGLQKYKTPHVFVGNKILNEEQKDFLKNNLWGEPIAYLDFDATKTTPFESTQSEKELQSFENMLKKFEEILKLSEKREVRATNFWKRM